MMTATYSLLELKNVLGELNINSKLIFAHSSLIHLGFLSDCEPADYPSALINACLDSIGPSGTLAMPAPFWDYASKSLPFDVSTSPVSKPLGVVSRVFCKQFSGFRSYNPLFSIAATGLFSKTITNELSCSDFGYNSAWDLLHRKNSYILLLGATISTLTFVRYIESRFGVPYLYRKLFNNPILENGIQKYASCSSLLRYRSLNVEYDLTRFEELLISHGLLTRYPLGDGFISLLRMTDCFSVACEALQKDTHFFLRSIPDYDISAFPIK